MKKLLFILFVTAFTKLNAQKMIEPPGGFEIMRWYYTGFPKTHNGWRVSGFEDEWKISGYTEGMIFWKVSVYCDTCGYLDKYVFDVSFVYGDKTELTVRQNKDSTDKYMKIKYPELK